MSKCHCGGPSESSWTGIIKIHPPKDDNGPGFSDDGIFASVRLNSYRVEGPTHLYALTVAAVEVEKRFPVTRVAVNLYAASSAPYSQSPQSLSVISKNIPIGISALSVRTTDETDFELYVEKPNGHFLIERQSVRLLHVEATVDILGRTLKTHYQVVAPSFTCSHTETKCVHDKCGPSWQHYSCNYHCIARLCFNDGSCGPWSKAGKCGVDCF
jgi:hypothetical protein